MKNPKPKWSVAYELDVNEGLTGRKSQYLHSFPVLYHNDEHATIMNNPYIILPYDLHMILLECDVRNPTDIEQNHPELLYPNH